MKTNIKSKLSIFAAVAGMAASEGTASANPRPLPFSYPYATLAEGALETELYTDVTALRVEADPYNAGRGRLWEPGYQLQTEIEYGLTDRWELGFYQVFEATPRDGGTNGLAFDGLKFRARTRLAEAGEWPVDVSLYLELETLHDEVGLEEKLNLERRFGRARVMSNLWVEQSLVRPFDGASAGSVLAFIINPTLGVTYQLTPTFHPGIEYWGRGQIQPTGDTAQARNNTRVHHFVGPAIHLNFGKLWWSVGLYAHLNDSDKPQPGDLYGPVWFRTVLGLELGG